MVKRIDQINLVKVGTIIAVCYAVSLTVTMGLGLLFVYPIVLANTVAMYPCVCLACDEDWGWAGAVLLIGLIWVQYMVIFTLL